MHVFPQLRKLELKYQNELAVIGVHSPKFPNERDTDCIRMAIERYEVSHPVINDEKFEIWNSYACRAWPTLMFIDPLGKVVGKHEGEASFEALDFLLMSMVEEFDSQNLLDRSLLDHRLDYSERETLSFPGKIVVDGKSDAIFISDSNHNRIIQTTLAGELVQTIGGVTAGFQDGDFILAAFNHPQGMVLDGNFLYVADTENHAIRMIDLSEQYVETVAGIGTQSSFGSVGGNSLTTPLNSPWDLELLGDFLYIAMAGCHQIWALDLRNLKVFPKIGSGREDIIDGIYGLAALAQTSGLAIDGDSLYFADSETSSIRKADLGYGQNVTTIVGQGLFEFGDVDGAGSAVRLQHPSGICWLEGSLYVTDTYNHKIKKVCPETKTTTTIFGSGHKGFNDGIYEEATFYEPSGLSAGNGKLFIADTNNHVIRVADLESGEVSTLKITGL